MRKEIVFGREAEWERERDANGEQTENNLKHQFKSIENEPVKVIAKPNQTKLTIEANNIFKFIVNKVAVYFAHCIHIPDRLCTGTSYNTHTHRYIYIFRYVIWESAPLCQNIMRLMRRIHTRLAYVSAMKFYTHTLLALFLSISHRHQFRRNVLEYLYTYSCSICSYNVCMCVLLCVYAVQNGNDCWNVFNMRKYLKWAEQEWTIERWN